jgi:DNA-binding Lrp family transcriptional regulator
MVGLNSQAEHDLVAFEQTVAGWAQVRECYMLAGENDFILKIVARDWDAYQTFLTRELTALQNVAHVKTALTIRCSKSEPGVPVDMPAEEDAAS